MSEQIEPKTKLNRSVLNMIRTTQRNNIDLKHIADNKANILMSINALMITFLFPIIFSNLDLIIDQYFYIPMGILAITCLITVFISATVLRPFSSKTILKKEKMMEMDRSPFFFGNYHNMDSDTYFNYFNRVTSDEDALHRFIVDDLHFYGKILATKYNEIKLAYFTFKIGLFLTITSMIIVIIVNQ